MTRVMEGKQPACVHHCMTKCMARSHRGNG
ncbi:MAG: hypothetical protein JRF50_02145 [Deltaproteobacteria bacterium]|nr:hypothetical protein [Deltaproteobacteria bacterium]